MRGKARSLYKPLAVCLVAIVLLFVAFGFNSSTTLASASSAEIVLVVDSDSLKLSTEQVSLGSEILTTPIGRCSNGEIGTSIETITKEGDLTRWRASPFIDRVSIVPYDATKRIIPNTTFSQTPRSTFNNGNLYEGLTHEDLVNDLSPVDLILLE